MKNTIQTVLRASVWWLALNALTLGIVNAQAEKGSGTMALHHLHMSMMNHGMEMALQGSDLVMLSEMSMAPGFDATTQQHGRSMIQKGQDLLKRALEGSEMKGLHQGKVDEKAMQYTHSAGEAMQKVVDILDAMRLTEPKPEEMTLHHMHMALNHALEMGAEGSNLVMLGQMGMAGAVDTASIDHGKAMIAEARTLWKETMEGKAMQELMKGGESGPMAKTHQLAEAGKKVLDALAEMPEISK